MQREMRWLLRFSRGGLYARAYDYSLLQFIIRGLNVPFSVRKLRIHGDDVTFVLRRNLILCGRLIYCFLRVHFAPREIHEVLREVGVLLELIPCCNRNVSADDGIDIFDGCDYLRERLWMRDNATSIHRVNVRQRLQRKHVARMHRAKSGKDDERIAIRVSAAKII